jgi:hypothetical protein
MALAAIARCLSTRQIRRAREILADSLHGAESGGSALAMMGLSVSGHVTSRLLVLAGPGIAACHADSAAYACVCCCAMLPSCCRGVCGNLMLLLCYTATVHGYLGVQHLHSQQQQSATRSQSGRVAWFRPRCPVYCVRTNVWRGSGMTTCTMLLCVTNAFP